MEIEELIAKAEEQGTQSSVLVIDLAEYIKDNPPVPPQPTDIVFIGNENADLLEFESDLPWYEETKIIAAAVFVKSTAYDKIVQAVIEVEGTQIITTEGLKFTIAEVKENEPTVVIPQGFGDSDYLITYTAPNVDDITEGDKAKVVLIDSGGEEFAQTVEKDIYIVPWPQTVDIVFIGNENAALFGIESDLAWNTAQEKLDAYVFVKSAAYDKITQPVIEIDGNQISVTESMKLTILEYKEQTLSDVIPDGFSDSDYFIIYSAANVDDITEGDRAKVVLIGSGSEEFAQTDEKEIHIM